MAETPAFPLKVFYDGSCPVCRREMEAYRSKGHGGRLLFVDIGAPGFDPTPFAITLDAFMFEMHCIDREGRVFRGVEAFWAIWLAFPDFARYRFLALLVELPGVNSLARLIYRIVARNRKYLPKERDPCPDGSCRRGRDERR